MSEGLVWKWKGWRVFRVFAEDAPRQTTYALYALGDDECSYYAFRADAEWTARSLQEKQ